MQVARAERLSPEENPLLSRTAQYGLRASLYLASRPDERFSASHLSEELDVPENYMSKVLHTLTRWNVLSSSRGPQGGYSLARPAEETHLISVVEPFDSIQVERGCLLGREECGDDSPCPAHEAWKEVGDSVAAFFREKTIQDLLEGNTAGEEVFDERSERGQRSQVS